MESYDRDEILRLRDRMHEMQSELSAVRLHVDSLREWRGETRTQFQGFTQRCDELADQIERVLKSDEIAEAVATKVNATHTLHLTLVQRTAAFVVGVASLAAALKVLVT